MAGAVAPGRIFLHPTGPTAFAFCLFLFFENWLYTATYMADARAMVLPLVTAGDADYVEHDWNTIFSGLGVLQYDTRIAALVWGLGWCGMLGTVAWLMALSWNRETMGNPESCPERTVRGRYFWK